MRIFGNCGQCGRPIEESKKTCGANMVICKKCKMLIHVHCIGEHRLRHKTINDELKASGGNANANSLFSRIFSPIRKLFSGSND